MGYATWLSPFGIPVLSEMWRAMREGGEDVKSASTMLVFCGLFDRKPSPSANRRVPPVHRSCRGW